MQKKLSNTGTVNTIFKKKSRAMQPKYGFFYKNKVNIYSFFYQKINHYRKKNKKSQQFR